MKKNKELVLAFVTYGIFVLLGFIWGFINGFAIGAGYSISPLTHLIFIIFPIISVFGALKISKMSLNEINISKYFLYIAGIIVILGLVIILIEGGLGDALSVVESQGLGPLSGTVSYLLGVLFVSSIGPVLLFGISIWLVKIFGKK